MTISLSAQLLKDGDCILSMLSSKTMTWTTSCARVNLALIFSACLWHKHNWAYPSFWNTLFSSTSDTLNTFTLLILRLPSPALRVLSLYLLLRLTSEWLLQCLTALLGPSLSAVYPQITSSSLIHGFNMISSLFTKCSSNPHLNLEADFHIQIAIYEMPWKSRC